MPFVNLTVAQAAAAWIAAPNLVGFILQQGPAFNYAVAAVGALIILIGAFIGSRITNTIAKPTLLSLVAAVSFAIIAAFAVSVLIGERATQSELFAHLFTFAPVAAAIAGYFYTARPQTAA
ncbi:MAG: hypothetical protein K2Y42_02300 [Hyphomicrobium sp.]|jgi:uncharacterized membrane protein YfcA|uniref:hypothetical protein n=1 Tax=Hyphomicrobium sp. TaxID=82 RepID=UPI0025C5FF5A|nr:hypothetical protein [Hyphomicrobium sp.]MBX9861561.1 hypothetical protein [Hyphomicrobium sp.]